LESLKERIPIDLVLQTWGFSTADYWSSSGWRSATCPIHEDEHPSAGISPESDYLRCLACGWEGDVIALTMAVEHKSFQEAVKWLEDLMPPSDITTSW
jgi:DNA primase